MSCTTCDQLRGLIKVQLGENVCNKFDVGYYQNNSVVTDNMSELRASIRKAECSILWCDGLSQV